MKDKQFLEDVLAFIQHVHNDDTLSTDESYFKIIGTLTHDLNGIINEDRCFRPRCSGYSKLDQ